MKNESPDPLTQEAERRLREQLGREVDANFESEDEIERLTAKVQELEPQLEDTFHAYSVVRDRLTTLEATLASSEEGHDSALRHCARLESCLTTLEGALKAKAEEWRQDVGVSHDDFYDGMNAGRKECAKELDALWSSSASGPAPQVHVRGEWNSDQWNTCSCGVIDCPDARPAQGEEPR